MQFRLVSFKVKVPDIDLEVESIEVIVPDIEVQVWFLEVIVPDIEAQFRFNEVIVPDIQPTSCLIRCGDIGILLNTEMTKQIETLIRYHLIIRRVKQIDRLEFGQVVCLYRLL